MENILIQQLLDDPQTFSEKGSANELLKEYFRGLPIGTLGPLLESKELLVKKAAIWIASELDKKTSPLLNKVIPYLDENEIYLRFYALETVFLCSVEENIKYFIHVVRALEDESDAIRVHAMKLISNASVSQIESAINEISNFDNAEDHRIGLLSLLTEYDASRIDRLESNSSTGTFDLKYEGISAKRAKNKAALEKIASLGDNDLLGFCKL